MHPVANGQTSRRILFDYLGDRGAILLRFQEDRFILIYILVIYKLVICALRRNVSEVGCEYEIYRKIGRIKCTGQDV